MNSAQMCRRKNQIAKWTSFAYSDGTFNARRTKQVSTWCRLDFTIQNILQADWALEFRFLIAFFRIDDIVI